MRSSRFACHCADADADVCAEYCKVLGVMIGPTDRTN